MAHPNVPEHKRGRTGESMKRLSSRAIRTGRAIIAGSILSTITDGCVEAQVEDTRINKISSAVEKQDVLLPYDNVSLRKYCFTGKDCTKDNYKLFVNNGTGRFQAYYKAQLAVLSLRQN